MGLFYFLFAKLDRFAPRNACGGAWGLDGCWCWYCCWGLILVKLLTFHFLLQIKIVFFFLSHTPDKDLFFIFDIIDWIPISIRVCELSDFICFELKILIFNSILFVNACWNRSEHIFPLIGRSCNSCFWDILGWRFFLYVVCLLVFSTIFENIFWYHIL